MGGRKSGTDLIDLRIDRRQLTVLVAATLAIAAMVFFLGVVVGRRMASGPIAPETASSVAVVAEPAAAVEAADDPLAELDEQAEATGKPAPTAVPSVDPTAKPDVPTAQAAPTDAAPTTSPAPQPVPSAAKPAAVAAASADHGGYFTVQVASVRKPDSAEVEVKRLRAKGHQDVHVVSADLGAKGTWHRVLVGRFASQDEAEGFKKTFEGKEGRSGTLVKKIVP